MINKILVVLKLSICFLIIFNVGYLNGYWTTYSKSNATSGAQYYDNNPSSLTASQQKVLNEKYGGDASKVTDDGKCWNICRSTLDAGGSNARVSANWSSSSTDYSSDNILGQYNSDLREGNVDMNTVADVIIAMVEVLIGIAGTVAVFSLIYHGLQMQINSGITGDSSGVDKAKKWMIDAWIGFVIAISAWFLVTRAVDLLNFVS